MLTKHYNKKKSSTFVTSVNLIIIIMHCINLLSSDKLNLFSLMSYANLYAV